MIKCHKFSNIFTFRIHSHSHLHRIGLGYNMNLATTCSDLLNSTPQPVALSVPQWMRRGNSWTGSAGLHRDICMGQSHCIYPCVCLRILRVLRICCLMSTNPPNPQKSSVSSRKLDKLWSFLFLQKVYFSASLCFAEKYQHNVWCISVLHSFTKFCSKAKNFFMFIRGRTASFILLSCLWEIIYRTEISSE